MSDQIQTATAESGSTEKAEATTQRHENPRDDSDALSITEAALGNK